MVLIHGGMILFITISFPFDFYISVATVLFLIGWIANPQDGNDPALIPYTFMTQGSEIVSKYSRLASDKGKLYEKRGILNLFFS